MLYDREMHERLPWLWRERFLQQWSTGADLQLPTWGWHWPVLLQLRGLLLLQGVRGQDLQQEGGVLLLQQGRGGRLAPRILRL